MALVILKSQKTVEDIKESIVEQCVGLEVIIKQYLAISGRVALILFVVEQAT